MDDEINDYTYVRENLVHSDNSLCEDSQLSIAVLIR